MNATRDNQNTEVGQVRSWTQSVCSGSNLIGFFLGDTAMKHIPLTQGKFAIVDDDKYDELAKHKWFAEKGRSTYYAARLTPHINGKQHHIAMHRVLLGLCEGDGIFSDHRNGNGLDNRMPNLRTCSNSQNRMNSLIQTNNTSGYKGVSWHKGHNKWSVYITVRRQKIMLGSFFCLVKAAKAYDEAAIKYYGEFANTNFRRKKQE